MSNIQTGAERMPHDLSHLGFLAGQIGRLITISTTPVKIGRASCRERVEISVVAASLKKKPYGAWDKVRSVVERRRSGGVSDRRAGCCDVVWPGVWAQC